MCVVDSSEWDSRYSSVEHPWDSAPAAALSARFAELTPGRAIDLGCGDGRHARWLADAGWTVRAVDFSSVAIELARSGGEDRSTTPSPTPGPGNHPNRWWPSASCIYRSTSWSPSLPVQRVGSHRADGCCISAMRSRTSLTVSGDHPIRRSCPPSTISPAPRADCRSANWDTWSALSAKVKPSISFSMHSPGAPQLTVI
ncbi:class I SAM-dependent methyltransferase [Rhodococcus erythropolis]|uniref:class I SAM-dependent methyltransferase n=1 Tax=Rhodococcus erythropolis TaxID=1833 RepID=UPI0034CE5242